MKRNNLAPIVLFVYNRPWHTRKTVEALQKNKLAKDSELFIYSDEAKNKDARESVSKVRAYIDKVNGFKKITIIKQKENKSLANSIIAGVTEIVSKYGKIIVLEDDLVVSPYFLKFMNEALEFYKNKKKVWHISGWNYPIKTDGLDDVFFQQLMNCWGWATWSDRWQHYEKDVNKTMQEFSQEDIREFNLDEVENFWGQILANKEKKINTWAIFWYVTIFKQKGLCLNPSKTFVENIGHDGSGIHCGDSSAYDSNISYSSSISYISELKKHEIASSRIKLFYAKQKKSFTAKVINKLVRILTGKDIIK